MIVVSFHEFSIRKQIRKIVKQRRKVRKRKQTGNRKEYENRKIDLCIETGSGS